MADPATRGARPAYAKSEATRGAIIAAALAEFGDHGFASATTRRIADRAGIALPAIAYHFGGKAGLYIACAEQVVARFHTAVAVLVPRAATLWKAGLPDPDACRALLADTMKMLLRLFLDPVDGQAQADFATRELRDRGPAFDIMYERLWVPGVDAVAQLVAAIRGSAVVTPDARADSLQLISSLLAFGTGRDVSLRILGVHNTPAEALRLLDQAIDRSVAGLSARADTPRTESR